MMNGLCRCGCGKRTSIAPRNRFDRGWVKGQPVPFIHGHNPILPLFQRVARFWSYAKLTRDFGWPDCIEWGGVVSTNGYGQFCGRMFGTRQAHRIAYILTFGLISKGLEPDHLCRNRLCINPYHLELVTRKVNSRRGAKAKLTNEIVMEIRSSSEPSRVLAARYGVSHATILAARTKRSWS